MFKPFYGICKGREGKYVGCGNDGWITTKSRGLCSRCEAKRNTQSETKRFGAKYKPQKSTGEYAVFEEIASERPHVCFVTDTRVNIYTRDGKLNVWCFAHVVGKGTNVSLRKHKPNIQIVHPWVHTVYDRGGRAQRKEMEKYPGWHRLLRLKDEIKEWYSQNKKRART